MGEEVVMISNYDGMAASVGDDERVLEWETGLPNADDLTPLSQPLIPPELASAFSISPEPSKTLLDVHRASQSTVSSLRRQVSSNSSSASIKMFPSLAPAAAKAATDRDDPDPDPVVVEGDEGGGKEGGLSETESSKKVRGAGGSDEMEDFDSGSHMENDENSNSGRASKKPRLVWTPQLHKRFVEVVAHLGLKNAVPKTIMQLMNVEGLTRENVASHLQKYRLYMKRMQGISDEGPSSPPPPPPPPPPDRNSRQETAATRVPMPMPYVGAPGMIPMPVIGMGHHGHGGPLGMMPVGGQPGGGRSRYHGFESHHPYAMFGERPREWPRGNHFGSPVPYPHPGSNDKS